MVKTNDRRNIDKEIRREEKDMSKDGLDLHVTVSV